MNNNNINQETQQNLDHDHEEGEQELCDVVMPGFRFHPTEEELVEFYLRRKVEGKRFNVELITFLDLYRYDPWELPGLAAIGEKEWYFYVPRDKKYRNGDRPNRVTTSGYWKATGADRMIRSENQRSIGLKKTLVFYSGKAPKGIRTSWIMNEYRLPLHDTERLQKAEISLCRVYKRAGVEDHPSLPRSLPTTRASSSKTSQPNNNNNNHHRCDQPANNQATVLKFQTNHGKSPQQITDVKSDEPSPTSSTDIGNINPSFPFSNNYTMNNNNTPSAIPPPPMITPAINDDLHKIVNNINSNNYLTPDQYLNSGVVPINLVSRFSTNLQPAQPQAPVPGSFQASFPERLWEWNGISEESNKDFTNLFK